MNIYLFYLFMNYIRFNLFSIHKQLLSSFNIIKNIWLLIKKINSALSYIILHSIENIKENWTIVLIFTVRTGSNFALKSFLFFFYLSAKSNIY